MNKEIKTKLIELKLGSSEKGLTVLLNKFESTSSCLDFVGKKLKEGIRIIELDPDKLSDSLFLELAQKIKQLCELFESTLIIKNRADVAYLTSADCVNLNKDSMDPISVRKLIGDDFLIGKSIYITDSYETNSILVKDGVDYIIIEHIYSTPTAPVLETGIEYAKWVSENNLLPVLIKQIQPTTNHQCAIPFSLTLLSID